MGQESKQQAQNRLRGLGIEGSMSRSQSGSETVRGRRGAQRESDFAARFNTDQFALDSEGRVSLKITSKPLVRTVPIGWRQGETGAATRPPIVDIGYASGPGLADSNDEIFATWPIAGDCDRNQPLTLRVNAAQNGVDAGAVTFTVEVWAYDGAENFVAEVGSPDQTLTGSFTTTTTTGDSYFVLFSLEPSKLLLPSAISLFFRLMLPTSPGTTDIVFPPGTLAYTSLSDHVHE